MTLLLTDRLYLEHHAPGHVESPERLLAILEHFQKRGLLERLTPLSARDATLDELALIHDRDYIQAIQNACQRGGGWLDQDTYLNERSYDAAVRAAGGVLAAVDAVDRGADQTALCLVRPPGHHATPERGMGFCLFNNVAIAARRLKRRVLIVDWDVHHGNGTQEAFYQDPTVWYFSTHRAPFYPGTGRAEERGLGNILNIPMHADTSREEFLERFEGALERSHREFAPEFVLISCGFDAYFRDPIGGLNLRPEDYRTMTDRVRALGAPVVSALEGGYDLEGLGLCAEEHVLGLLAETPKRGPGGAA